MRQLSEDELEKVFEKLSKYMGKNVEALLRRTDDVYVFRLSKSRVYYMPERLSRLSQSIPKESISSIGTCFGKFTKSGKFLLHVTCLDYVAQYAQFKVWVKPSSEMSFLYGNHLLKSGLGRITDNVDAYSGVVVYSMADIPLGFGVAAVSTEGARKLQPNQPVVLRIADVGQYLREEATL